MPNGGFICCDCWTHGRGPKGCCDVHGTPLNPQLVCGTFRSAKQSHTEARTQWPVPAKMEPGVVYSFENVTYSTFSPKPELRMVPVSGGTPGPSTEAS